MDLDQMLYKAVETYHGHDKKWFEKNMTHQGGGSNWTPKEPNNFFELVMVFRHEFSSGNSLLQEILVLKFQELFVFHAVLRKFLRMTGFFSCFRDFFHLKNSCLDISAQEINRCQKSHKIVYLEHSNPYLICSMISIFQSAAPNSM